MTASSSTTRIPRAAGGDPVPEKALLKADQPLVLHYTYHIDEAQIGEIKAGAAYYLKVSPHLMLPDLGEGSALTMETEDGDRPFGTLYANGESAWVTFLEKEGGGTVLSELVDGDLTGGWFDLTCFRAEDVPEDAGGEMGRNLYVMKFETTPESSLLFGYAENEPVTAKAKLSKGGSCKDRTITWSIDYTPWQNPDGTGGIAPDTPFELRDTIHAGSHSYRADSVRINGEPVREYDSRDAVDGVPERYVIVDRPEDGGNTILIFGGTDFRAGTATQGNPAKSLKITYETEMNDVLLLPGSAGGAKVTNTAQLFAGPEAESPLDVDASAAVTVPRPEWLKKEGTTERHTDGTGSTTHWTITFYPNGFSFDSGSRLTLWDQIPEHSALIGTAVQVKAGDAGAREVPVVSGENRMFTVSGIETDGAAVTVTYDTHVGEEAYESHVNLGRNAAWFTFDYGGGSYETAKVQAPVGSGDGSGTPVTDPLVKTGGSYAPGSRSITWTVKINPHKTYLTAAELTDNLGIVGLPCAKGHKSGLELVGGVENIDVKIDGKEPKAEDRDLVTLKYDEAAQVLSVEVGKIGPKAIQLTYTTKVCDPCVFANNCTGVRLKNTVEGTMTTGWSNTKPSQVDASGETVAGATVLMKKTPVYDYAGGCMTWTVEVDAAGLPMEDVVLTDRLPQGLTYVPDSLKPAIGAAAAAEGQTLTITLDEVRERTTVVFDTKVDPEAFGFNSGEPVRVENTIRMNGRADGVIFETSHRVEQTFDNHGLVKRGQADKPQELIRYEVLVNPYGLALPGNPALEDTLDPRLQLDTDSLKFYRVKLTGTTADDGQKPGFQKLEDTVRPLKLSGFDPADNRFTVRLPVEAGSRDAYVLTYTADIMDLQAGSYSNSVQFDGGGAVLLGGREDSAVSVSGGGGAGGGAAASRRAVISVEKVDSETNAPITGVTFTLYQWDSENNRRGLPFGQGMTDEQGKLSFKVKPNTVYMLEETESIPGYSGEFGWTELPQGVTKTEGGLLITAGAAKSEVELELTNRAYTTDPDQEWTLTVNKIISGTRTPLAGAVIGLYEDDGCEKLLAWGTSGQDGTVVFSGLMKGRRYWLKEIEAPARYDLDPTVYEAGEEEPAVTITNTPQAPSVDPGGSANPDTPHRPGPSGRPGTSGKPGTPNRLDAPDKPDSPGVPGEPGDPGTSGSSGVPGEPGDPGTSGSPGAAGGPGAAGSDGGSASAGASDIPQTGDDTWFFAAVTLASGFLLAAMTLYRLLERRKRERQ